MSNSLTETWLQVIITRTQTSLEKKTVFSHIILIQIINSEYLPKVPMTWKIEGPTPSHLNSSYDNHQKTSIHCSLEK